MDVIRSIYEANKNRRSIFNMLRRISKAMEELGELSEAFLYTTSEENSKEKTWEDVREEAVDLILMSVDLALTPMPTDVGKTDEEIQQDVVDMIKKKLTKWEKQIQAGKDCTLTKKSIY